MHCKLLYTTPQCLTISHYVQEPEEINVGDPYYATKTLGKRWFWGMIKLFIFEKQCLLVMQVVVHLILNC